MQSNYIGDKVVRINIFLIRRELKRESGLSVFVIQIEGADLIDERQNLIVCEVGAHLRRDEFYKIKQGVKVSFLGFFAASSMTVR